MSWQFKYIRLSPKLVKRYGFAALQDDALYAHWCPACKTMHDFSVDQPFRNGARWVFDGNVTAPTMTPSMNIRIGPFPDGTMHTCHYFLTAGRILFLADCSHELKGTTVDLPDIPDAALRNSEELH